MAQGDAADFAARLRAALPLRWFPDEAPVLGGVLAGLAAAWAAGWDNLQFAVAQTRIATATGAWLDAVAADFFGGRVARGVGQGDAGFRALILAELLRARATRAALVELLTELTGSAPAVFEPTNVRDTGAWGGGGAAAGLFYGVAPAGAADVAGAGGWGNAGLVLQILATAAWPENPTQSAGGLMAATAGVMPCAGVAWLRLLGPGPAPGAWILGETYLPAFLGQPGATAPN